MTETISKDFIKRLNDYQPVIALMPEGMELPFEDTTPFDEDKTMRMTAKGMSHDMPTWRAGAMTMTLPQ